MKVSFNPQNVMPKNVQCKSDLTEIIKVIRKKLDMFKMCNVS